MDGKSSRRLSASREHPPSGALYQGHAPGPAMRPARTLWPDACNARVQFAQHLVAGHDLSGGELGFARAREASSSASPGIGGSPSAECLWCVVSSMGGEWAVGGRCSSVACRRSFIEVIPRRDAGSAGVSSHAVLLDGEWRRKHQW